MCPCLWLLLGLQEEGTAHLRTTILPREEQMATFVDKFRKFHESFMKKYK